MNSPKWLNGSTPAIKLLAIVFAAGGLVWQFHALTASVSKITDIAEQHSTLLAGIKSELAVRVQAADKDHARYDTHLADDIKHRRPVR